jgi:hypothetical protein
MNEQPIKPELAEAYETALNAYGDKYEEATSRLRWRGGLTALRRFSDTVEDQEEKFAGAIEDLRNRIVLLSEALAELQTADKHRTLGEPALYEYETALGRWHEQNRYRELYEENPEAYTLHAIAVKKVMREAEEKAGKPWNKLTNYWLTLSVYETVQGLTREESEEALTAYIESRQMSYTVSTKNLKMKVA